MDQLKYGQKIVFTIKDKNYKYKVEKSFLQAEKDSNNQIFLDLKIDKIKLANSAYGYDSDGGDWPESKLGDFAALTRLVAALCYYCDRVIVDNEVIYSKSENTIFKELESTISSSNSESSDIIDFESIIQPTKIKLTFI